MPRTDFLFSLFLIGLGVATLVESIRMPTMSEFGYGGYAAPGIVPGIVGVIIAFLGILLLVRAARAGGWHFNSGPGAAPGAIGRLVRGFGVALGLILLYAVVLVGSVPFWLATFLFVFAFIAFFEWVPGIPSALRYRRLGMALLQAVIVSISITFLFERIFLVQLPG